MKKIILISFLLLNLISFSQTSELNKWRKNYFQSPRDSTSCAKLYKLITKENSKDNTVICYKGAITAQMAGYLKDKKDKLKLFVEGKKLIEEAILKDSNNVELHFIRFTVQTNCPKALGYYKQIEPDKKKIISSYKSIDNPGLLQMVDAFVAQSTYFTEEEKSKFH